MKRKIHLINPAPDCPSYFSLDVMQKLNGRKAAQTISLALPTVAAMIPADDFDVTICDEVVEPVDFEVEADYIVPP